MSETPLPRTRFDAMIVGPLSVIAIIFTILYVTYQVGVV